MFDLRATSRVFLIVALALSTLGVDALLSQGRQPKARRIAIVDGREVVEGEVIVRYRSQTGRIQRERAEFQVEGDTSEAVGRRGARRVRSRRLTTRQMLTALRANPDVEFAEPNFIIRASALPNDPSMGALWGLRNTGQSVEGRAGVPGADIGAAEAWDLTTGSRATVIAILDTGIDYTHPDLAANVFSAPNQFTVTIGSTTVTCPAGSRGFNVLNNSCDPFDDSGHGSHVAGIIGAVGNNNAGITGVNWTTSMMAIKVLDADGTGTTTDAINGIEFVIKTKAALGANANVRVLNASWGGPNLSQALQAEIDAANNADMLFVAAAGSDSSNNDTTPHYPASYASGNVLSVAAFDNTGVLAPFSNYGATSVDLAAPGDSILSTLPDNAYGRLTGTSMAAPYVAGAAALVLSACPSNTATLKARLLADVDPHASLAGKTVSGGRLNVGAVIQRCLPILHATINGSTITATVENGPGNRLDWLTLYCPPSKADNAYDDWKYLNNSQTGPATGTTAATVTFTAPSQSGVSCNVRLLANNQVVKLATSETVTTGGGGATPTLSIGDITVAEGNSGTSAATFTVTLSPVNASQTVTVNYATANGTATSGSDYVAGSGTLNFPPSTATRTFTVMVQGDTSQENNETFLVNLSSAINAAIGDAQASGTITNDDVPAGPTVSVGTTNVSPGATISFTVANGPANPKDWVTLSATSAPDSTYVDWKYLNGSKTAPATGQSGATLQFTAPSTPGSYNIRFFANNSLANKLATSPTITVATPPAQSSLTIGNVSVTEGNSGTSMITFTVTLSPVNSSQTVTVNYATANGTATAGGDYTAASGTLTFAPSTATQTLGVIVSGDTTVEPNETFLVNLSGATNAVIGDAQATGTINNDDGPAGPTVSLDSSSVNPGGTISFTVSNGPANPKDWVTLSATSAPDNTYVDWKYLNGSKTAPATGQSGATLQFTAPSTPGTYNIRFFANNSLANKLATSPTINVGMQPSLTIANVSISEGASGTSMATFTVTLSPVNASQTVTVNYATADGTASASGGDYVAASGTLTFAPSTATQTLNVTVNGDSVVEPTETFVVNLSGATNAAIGDAQATGTIMSDEAAAGPAISLASSAVQPGAIIQFTVAGGPANPMDWVTLSPESAPDNGYLDWKYLNGMKTAPATGQSGATLQFTAPSTPGTYNIRFFADNRLTNKLATSPTITVAP